MGAPPVMKTCGPRPARRRYSEFRKRSLAAPQALSFPLTCALDARSACRSAAPKRASGPFPRRWMLACWLTFRGCSPGLNAPLVMPRLTVYRAQGVKSAPCAVFGGFLACFLVRRLAGARSCRRMLPPILH